MRDLAARLVMLPERNVAQGLFGSAPVSPIISPIRLKNAILLPPDGLIVTPRTSQSAAVTMLGPVLKWRTRVRVGHRPLLNFMAASNILLSIKLLNKAFRRRAEIAQVRTFQDAAAKAAHHNAIEEAWSQILNATFCMGALERALDCPASAPMRQNRLN